MSPTPASSIRQVQVAMSRRAGEQQQTYEFSGGPHLCSGKFLMEGTGEVVVDIDFPLSFLEEPMLSFGAALEENQNAELGNLPTISVVVLRYFWKENSTGAKLYRGARVGSVCTGGGVLQRLWVHLHFSGTALVNPVQQNSIDQVL